MRDYESVSNLLFQLRHCECSLVSFWERSMRTSCPSLLKTRLVLQRLIASLSTYVFSEIEQLWSSLLLVFESCDSILTLLAVNKSFLQSLKRVTIENEHLCSSLASLVKIIEKLERMGRTRD